MMRGRVGLLQRLGAGAAIGGRCSDWGPFLFGELGMSFTCRLACLDYLLDWAGRSWLDEC